MMTPRTTVRTPLFWMLVGVTGLLSLAEFRTMFLLHQGNLGEIINSAWGLTVGQPHWVEYQNRLLAPWLVRGAAEVSGASFAGVYLGVVILFHLAKNLLCFLIIFRITGDSRAAGGGALLGSFLFLAFQDANWLYLWDYLDIIIFSLFLYGVLTHKGNPFFTMLFVPAVLNRDSGLFIALWLTMDGFVLREGGRWIIPHLRDRGRLLLGVGLMAAGEAFILVARKFLLVHETAAQAHPVFAAERPVHFATNTKMVWWSLTHPWFDLVFLPPLVAGGLAVFLLVRLRRMDDLLAKQALLMLAILLSISLVGLVAEARIYNILIPFLVLLPFHHPSEGIPPKPQMEDGG